jgi:hypothetical protein
MASMDRRKLQSKYFLMVDHISFASTAIGGRTAPGAANAD